MSKNEVPTSKLAVLKQDDVIKSISNALSVEQMNFLFAKTPEHQVKTRPAKGGGTWKYVTGAYVKKVLNLMFGFDWDFTVKDHQYDLNVGQAFVLGRLEVRTNGKTVVKEQFGRVEIKFKNEWVDGKKKPTNIPLDLGNDLKAATTDALKKCASELGIASDIYAENDYKELFFMEDMQEEDVVVKIQELLKLDLPIKEDDLINIERILEQEEVESYDKVLKMLIKLEKSKN